MRRLVEFPMEDGSTIWIEVDEQAKGGPVPVSAGHFPEKATQTFEAAVHKIIPIAQSVLDKFKNMEKAPHEIEVTFGFNVNTEVGAIIATASTSANFSVLLRWSKDQSKSS